MESFVKVFKGDKVIWLIYFVLCVISLVEVFSAGSRLSYKSGAYWMPLIQHSLFLLCGLFLVLILLHLPYKWFQIFPLFLLPFSLFFLVYTLFSGEGINGASRWIHFLGIQFQPSELAKFAMVIFAAGVLAKKQDDYGPDPHAFKRLLWPLLIFCGLIVTENLSTSALLFLVIFMMMCVGRIPAKKLLTLLGSLIGVAALAVFLVMVSPNKIGKLPVFHRVEVWFDRIHDYKNANAVSAKEFMENNEQVGHARIAVATSSFFGKGPGNSVQRDFLSEAASDFIFAIIIEEMGWFGGFIIVLLYLLLLIRAGWLATKCNRTFPAFLLMGIALMIVTQAMVNMMVAVGLLPVTGQPLPLISKGGTSTLINCMYIGMMLSVSRYVHSLIRKKNKMKNSLDASYNAAQPTARLLNEDSKMI